MSVAATRIIATILIAFTVAFGAPRASCSETATADDTARFLAGLQPPPNSPLAGLAKDLPGSRTRAILIPFLPVRRMLIFPNSRIFPEISDR